MRLIGRHDWTHLAGTDMRNVAAIYLVPPAVLFGPGPLERHVGRALEALPEVVEAVPRVRVLHLRTRLVGNPGPVVEDAVDQPPEVAADQAQAVHLVVQRYRVDFAVLGLDAGLETVLRGVFHKHVATAKLAESALIVAAGLDIGLTYRQEVVPRLVVFWRRRVRIHRVKLKHPNLLGNCTY